MTNDPKGYYEILGIHFSATNDEIKKAFREKAHILHPDKNQKKDTTKIFQFLVEAYDVLINSEKRANYDVSGIHVDENPTKNEPIKCSCCKKVTAQPRYVIFFEVKSFLVVTTRNTLQGIFCVNCAQKKNIQPTLITWFLGWWGLPWGVLYSIHALTINLFGGQKPKDINADILGYQAYYFAQQGKLDIANSIINDALKFSKEKEQIDNLKNFQKILIEQNNNKNFQKLKNKWKLFSKSFFTQLAIILFVITLILVAVKIYDDYENEQIQIKKDEQIAYNLKHPEKALPKNGEKTQFFQYSGVTAPFRIVTHGDEHHLLKLEDYHTGTIKFEIFIRAGQTVETEIPLGSYRMKYAIGDKWYGEKDLFGKDTIYSKSEDEFIFKIEGNQVLGHTVELYLQRNGNLKTNYITADEF